MMKIAKPSILYPFLLLVFMIGCKQNKKESQSEMETTKTENNQNSIEETIFGEMPDGTKVKKFTLKNEAGMEVDVITYGGIITRWTAPDSNGAYEDIVLGFDDLDQYLDGSPFFGALIGRYGNRIANGKFSLDGETYTLATNDGDNHLHGGEKGFDKVVWDGVAKTTEEGAAVELTYTSEDGEEGYPGTLDVKVTYTLTDDNALDIQYEAVTDKPTVVNLTQHSYFNLSGELSEPVLDHEIYLNADTYWPVDGGLIPTGEFREVAGTPFDFTEPKPIGEEIEAENEQLSLGGGYDHCWVLNDGEEDFRLAASAHDGETGRLLEVYTNEPGIQFYSGNFLDGTLPSKTGGTYVKRSGFCLETQHYPDSPNQADFPSVRLNPGETYSSRTMYKLTTK